MAKGREKGDSTLVAPREAEEMPVASCKGWLDACEFCDKRFGKWLELEEDTLDTIPSHPGICMLALRTKTTTEVVDIFLDITNLQKTASERLDNIKSCVADKKSKYTKSIVLCRWFNAKNLEDKDVINLCAHWYNLGVLPKMTQKWPGLELLQKTSTLEFSDRFQKFCYPQKDKYWKKSKTGPSRKVEVVPACDWTKPCDVCDAYFSKWMRVDDVVNNDKAPVGEGVYMIAAHFGKNREVVDICFGYNNIKLKLQDSIKNEPRRLNNYRKNYPKFDQKNVFYQVRWLEMSDPASDNCCFLYAHWLNVGTAPLFSFRQENALPGKKLLEKSKDFVQRIGDKKWCLEIEVFKEMKNLKFRNKRDIINDLEDEMNVTCGNE